MDFAKRSRSVMMICSTCGSGDFEYEDEAGPIRCSSCDRIFTRDELIRENGHVIDAETEEMGADVFKDAEKDLSASLRRAFSGSKHIKFK